MMYPLVSELAVARIPVTVTCRVLGFSKQGYYRWKNRPYSDRDHADAVTINRIVDIHAKFPEFGYRLLADEIDIAENRVHRLCKAQQIRCRFHKPRRKSARPDPAVHDDLLQRDFTATGPNKAWVGDITEHPTGGGKLYMCSFKDLWSNRLVGYSIGPNMAAGLAVDALNNAVTARPGSAGVIVHTDRGSQFRSGDYQQALTRHKLRGSMGRVGTAADNAAAESFFSLLQLNVLNRQRWNTRADLRAAIVYWIEAIYHRRRRQRRLGKQTPIQYEQQAA